MTKFTTLLGQIEAADRRRQRERLRSQRGAERLQKQLQRAAESLHARVEVQLFEAEMNRLFSIHKACSPSRDWHGMRSAEPPTEPEWSSHHEKTAQERLDTFIPSLADKALRRAQKKRAELSAAVDEGKKQDAAEHQEAQLAYSHACEGWKVGQTLALRVLRGDPDAYIEAVEKYAVFDELASLGVLVECCVQSKSLVIAEIFVENEDIIPSESRSLLKTGNLSVKAMPKTQFHAAYQDYVCGSTIRVARELFALLPIEMVIVATSKDVLNTATGHLESQPVLSVAIPRATLDKLAIQSIDPSDALVNFVHRTRFLKTGGFAPIERLSPEDLVVPE